MAGSLSPDPVSPRAGGKRRVGWLGERVGDVAGDLGNACLQALRAAGEVALAELTPRAADRRLDLARVALHEALGLVAALTELALDLRAGPLDLTLELVTRGVAAALELLQVDVRRALELLHLALCGLTARVRPDRLDDVVASGKRGADTREGDALDLLSGGLEGGHLCAAGLLGGAESLSTGRARVTRRPARGGLGLAGAGLRLALLACGRGATRGGAALGARPVALRGRTAER